MPTVAIGRGSCASPFQASSLSRYSRHVDGVEGASVNDPGKAVEGDDAGIVAAAEDGVIFRPVEHKPLGQAPVDVEVDEDVGRVAGPQDVAKLGQREVDVVTAHSAEAAQLVYEGELIAVGAMVDFRRDGGGGELLHVVVGHQLDRVALGSTYSIAVDAEALFGIVSHYSIQVGPGALEAFEAVVVEDVVDGDVPA